MKRSRNSFRNNNFIKRAQILSAIVVALFLVVFLKLFQVQIVNHNFYKVLAQDQHEFSEKIIPERGEIFINDSYSDKIYPLAVNKELSLVYAVPKNIDDKKEVATKLAELLELDEEEVFKIISKKDDPYEVLKRKVSDEVVEKIKSEDITGIKTSPEIIRYYPGDSLAANVIGFVGYSGHEKVGQYGIEGYYNERLQGTMGFLELEKDSMGKWITFGSKNSQSSQDGDDIVLTIDQTIQYISETKLKEAVIKYGAESGNIIIMDPKTGAIVAMAQYPSFNPNEYFKEKEMNVFLNSSIHSVYEPGSIQKVITMAIGLDLGKISPSSTYFDYGFVKIDGWTIHNSDGKTNEKQTMTQILEKSLNTGSIFVQQQVAKKDFYNYLRLFKLDELTGIEINGEEKGSLSRLNSKKDINYATVSYGQGISVTPLSILTAISSFANDGKLMKPYIVSEFIKADGHSEKNKPKVVCQVVSPKTASLISAMMTSVIKNGHAKQAGIKGYKLAGKTGTAQIPKKNGRGYEEDKTIHTFVGFGPIPNPKFSILVKLDSPTNALYAANTTAVVFGELSQELVNYYNVPASH